MSKSRLEAFSDGVMAILITIMVLELKTPERADLAALGDLLPDVGIYALSFVFLGIYWNNHHHLFQLVQRVSGGVLWANLHLLFWLSLIPLTTRWVGQSDFESIPMAIYGVDFLLAGAAYSILVRVILACQPAGSKLAEAIGDDAKGYLSLALYLASIPLAFANRWLALALIVVVALIWLVPDRRIESRLATAAPPD